MRTSEVITLPRAENAYSIDAEQILRRTIEQTFQDLRNDVINVRDNTDKLASLAVRRHQFLLLGAVSG